VLTVGSLFAGIGGFDLAASRAGMEVRWCAEINPACRLVLAERFPKVRLYQDVKELSLDPHDSSSAERVDVLCGGFPCQDVSVAGRRSGLAGERSGLFYEFARLIEEGTPQWVVIENVPGLLSSNRGRDMGAVLGTLGELGYGWAYRVLDAQHFGVAQRRRRVFIVGCLGSGTGAGQVLFEPEGSGGDPPSCRAPGALSATLPETRPANGGEGVGTVQSVAFDQMVAFHPTQDPISSIDISHTMSAGNSQGCATVAVAYQCHGTNVGPMGTLRAGNGHLTGGVPFVEASSLPPSVLTSMVVRRLTPTECERLQGFDDDWTDVPDADGKPMPDSARYRMLGNAVAVPVAGWVLERLVSVEARRLAPLLAA